MSILFTFLNSAKEIEITDYAERKVYLKKPAERIIVMADNSFVVVKQLKAIDKVIALDSKTKGYFDLFRKEEVSDYLLLLHEELLHHAVQKFFHGFQQ